MRLTLYETFRGIRDKTIVTRVTYTVTLLIFVYGKRVTSRRVFKKKHRYSLKRAKQHQSSYFKISW